MTMLAAENVSVSFGGVAALRDVTLEVGEGEVVGLIGPNGAGKTTLVNVLTGYVRQDSGRVLLMGRDVGKLRPHQRARAGLARTFQGVRVFPRLTVLENVEAACCVHARRGRARASARSLVERIGLAEVASNPGGQLSHGDQRRLAVARALAAEPRVLLLDEPAAGLGDGEAEVVGAVVAEMCREMSCSILLIEHHVPFVMSMSDRVHVLAEGGTVSVGTPEMIRQDPAVVAAYFGEER